MTVSTKNAASPKSTKSRNSDSSVSRGTNSYRDFSALRLCVPETPFYQILQNRTSNKKSRPISNRTKMMSIIIVRSFQNEETSNFKESGRNRRKSGSLKSAGPVVRPLWRAAGSMVKAPLHLPRAHFLNLYRGSGVSGIGGFGGGNIFGGNCHVFEE